MSAVLTPHPTLPELIHWVTMQHCPPDAELPEAEIERLLRVDQWIIAQERAVINVA